MAHLWRADEAAARQKQVGGGRHTKFLCDALVGNNTLKELDLSGHTSFGGTGSNIGGTAGAKHVANMLFVQRRMTSLNLSMNDIGGHWDDDLGKIVVTPLRGQMLLQMRFWSMELTDENRVSLSPKNQT
jgi:hypothetical protein